MAPADLVDAANRSFIGSFRLLAEATGDSIDLRGAFAFSTGLNASLFNGCVIPGPTDSEAVSKAIEWVAGRAPNFRVWVDEDRVPEAGALLESLQLDRDPVAYPAMALFPLPRPPVPPPGVAVRRVSLDTLAEHIRMRLAEGTPPTVARVLYGAPFVERTDVELFTGYLDGHPVGGAMAIRTGDVAGVYAVGTLRDARRRGVGTATSWACVGAARRWGCRVATLQASEMGMPVYEAMGFRTVVPYAVYRRVSGGERLRLPTKPGTLAAYR